MLFSHTDQLLILSCPTVGSWHILSFKNASLDVIPLSIKPSMSEKLFSTTVLLRSMLEKASKGRSWVLSSVSSMSKHSCGKPYSVFEVLLASGEESTLVDPLREFNLSSNWTSPNMKDTNWEILFFPIGSVCRSLTKRGSKNLFIRFLWYFGQQKLKTGRTLKSYFKWSGKSVRCFFLYFLKLCQSMLLLFFDTIIFNFF